MAPWKDYYYNLYADMYDMGYMHNVHETTHSA